MVLSRVRYTGYNIMKQRTSRITRKTSETNVELFLNIDGAGEGKIVTGVGFLDHMLDIFARHANLELTVDASGDRHIDDHHTVEDVGICLGLALKDALTDKTGITRFASASVPMQDALANIAVDLSGRAALVYNVTFNAKSIGHFEVELIEEFLEALTANAGFNLHVNVPYGNNAHHIAEAVFKGMARAIRYAVAVDKTIGSVPSTKGVL